MDLHSICKVAASSCLTATNTMCKRWSRGLKCAVCRHAVDSGDAAMLAVFEEVVAPAAERFQPDLILVRATVG